MPGSISTFICMFRTFFEGRGHSAGRMDMRSSAEEGMWHMITRKAGRVQQYCQASHSQPPVMCSCVCARAPREGANPTPKPRNPTEQRSQDQKCRGAGTCTRWQSRQQSTRALTAAEYAHTPLSSRTIFDRSLATQRVPRCHQSHLSRRAAASADGASI